MIFPFSGKQMSLTYFQTCYHSPLSVRSIVLPHASLVTGPNSSHENNTTKIVYCQDADSKDFLRILKCDKLWPPTCLGKGVKNIFFIFRRVRKIAKSDYQLYHARPSVRMEQLGSHQTDFHETWYMTFSKTCRDDSSFIKI